MTDQISTDNATSTATAATADAPAFDPHARATERASLDAVRAVVDPAGKGDDGTTGLLYGGRIAKDDSRTEAYGTVDEAVAALGLARAELTEAGLDEIAESVLRWQRELFVVGADLATNPDARDRL